MAGWDTRPVNSGYTVIVGTTTGNYNNGVPDTYVKTWMEFKVIQDSTDVANNRSRVDVKLYSQVITGGSSTGMANTFTANNYGYAGYDNSNRVYLNTTYDFNGFALNKFADTTLTIPHNADGTKTIALQAAFNTLSGTWSITGGSATTNLTLPPIAQKTEITSISGLGYGSATTFNLSRKASNLREKVYLINGGTTLLIKDTNNSATTFNYTLPYSYAPNTTAPSPSTWTVKVETYNGTTLVGYIQTTCTFNIIDNAYKPTFSQNPTLSPYNDVVGAFGTYVAVAGYSKLRLSATKAQISTKYNATVVSRSVTFSNGGGTVSDVDASTYTSNKYNSAGTVTVTYTVTDSRGYTLTWTGTISVKSYSSPTVSVSECYRGTNTQAQSDSGTYAWGKATYSITSIKGTDNVERNSVSAFKAQVTGFSAVNLTNNTRAQLASGLSVSNVYTVTFTITDVTGTTTEVRTIKSEDIPFNIREGGKGAGIGEYCKGEGLLNIGYELDGAFKSKGGRYVATCNLIDQALIEQGNITTSGTDAPSTDASFNNYVRSGFCKVSANTTYAVQSNLNPFGFYWFEYDSSKTFLRYSGGGVNYDTQKTFSVGNNTAYIRCQFAKVSGGNVVPITPSDISSVMLEKGSSASSYVPFTLDGIEIADRLKEWRRIGEWQAGNDSVTIPSYAKELRIVPFIQNSVFQACDYILSELSATNYGRVYESASNYMRFDFSKSGSTLTCGHLTVVGWSLYKLSVYVK